MRPYSVNEQLLSARFTSVAGTEDGKNKYDTARAKGACCLDEGPDHCRVVSSTLEEQGGKEAQAGEAATSPTHPKSQ